MFVKETFYAPHYLLYGELAALLVADMFCLSNLAILQGADSQASAALSGAIVDEAFNEPQEFDEKLSNTHNQMLNRLNKKIKVAVLQICCCVCSVLKNTQSSIIMQAAQRKD